MPLNLLNPATVHAPLGLYSHTVQVPAGSELIYLSGQLGVHPDGSTPGDIGGQADQVFANLVALVQAHGLAVTDIVKLTTFMVAGQDGDAVRAARLKHLGAHRPASTAVFVPQLVDPAWFVEVEAVVARPPRPTAAADAGAGLFIYAVDAERLARFYQAVLGLERAGSAGSAGHGDLVTLRGPGLELLVHAIPAAIAAGIPITRPPARREDVALKFFFTVPALDTARATAAALGGEVQAEAWQGPGYQAAQAMDPEGNLFQLRQPGP